MCDLPAPLTPPDCNLRGLEFMAVDIIRILQSTLWIRSSGDEFKAAFALWCKSWQQVPAASLPDDELDLAHLSEARHWKKVRAVALRGWIKCSDGRLYHPVVAEKALDAWARRSDFQAGLNHKSERQRRWREQLKKLSQQLRDAGVTPPAGASLELLRCLLAEAGVAELPGHLEAAVDAGASTGDAGEMLETGTGTGTVKQRHTAAAVAVGGWRPDEQLLLTRLVMYGIAAPPALRLPQLLAQWRDHHAGKTFTEQQCYQSFAQWIRRDRYEQPSAGPHRPVSRESVSERSDRINREWAERAREREKTVGFG